MSKLTRFYSIASLIAMIAATVILTLFFRKLAIQDIVSVWQNINVNLAQTTLNSVRPEILRYLSTVEDRAPHDGITEERLSAPLAHALTTLMENTMVVRIKLYNRMGTVVYSTKTEQIGDPQENNGGVGAALAGKIMSNLIYRDTFNQFDGETEDDNLMSTYLPVRASPTQPVIGVFEIYTDVTPLVARNEDTEFIVLSGVGFILMALYLGLLLIVNRATKVIETQQQTIRERTEMLEMLSARKLKSEESEKRRIASNLHEGLAQTLCAAKVRLEAGYQRILANASSDASMRSVIAVLQDAIAEVETIASGLRPASLDLLGLVPTIDWFCREFEQAHRGIRIQRDIALENGGAPKPLEIVIYRIIETSLNNIAQHDTANRIDLELWREDGNIVLAISEMPQDLSYRPPLQSPLPALQEEFAEVYQRTLLSGGKFSHTYNEAGGIVLRAAWPVANELSAPAEFETSAANVLH